ncbi:hypothetical protein [Aeromonas caviae]|uniref:hypothetical protein n=1 Tax=Aeromonas caviae TaxID=648 RepID=UPI0029DD1478|nr:hypothetical protein [Aeromonas caviae]MDX7786174.1 hypothetical protein [Aeromonas caviae]
MLHRAGFRYRLHNSALPGKPDLWLTRYRAVIEVNGCFWQAKVASNRARDTRHLAELDQLCIRRLIIWECALKGRLRHDPERLLLVISWWLTSGISHGEIAGGRELQIAIEHSPHTAGTLYPIPTDAENGFFTKSVSYYHLLLV